MIRRVGPDVLEQVSALALTLAFPALGVASLVALFFGGIADRWRRRAA